MVLADVMIGSGNSSLENTEIALNRIGMSGAAQIFADSVIDHLMSEIPVHVAILSRIVGHQVRLGVHLGN